MITTHAQPSAQPGLEIKMAAGISGASDTLAAAMQASDQCLEGLGPQASTDLAVIFFSPHHLTTVGLLSSAIRRRLSPKNLIGVSCEAVIGGTQEVERSPGVSILAANLPGVRIKAFTTEDFPISDGSAEALFALRDCIGAGEDAKFTLLLADPFSLPLIKSVPDLNNARIGGEGNRASLLFGGLASATMHAGGNALLLNDRVVKYGGVGVTLGGPLRVDTIVSQGCRPFGPQMIVTKARNNLILELGGVKAIEAVQDVLNQQGESRHKLLSGGLFMGLAISEHRARLGRDDFMIRKIIGVRPDEGAIAVAELVKPGQTVRLHTRDADIAREDMAMLLDAQRLYERPKGALLISANTRGRRFFKDRPNDASSVVRAFSQPSGGEELSRPGTPYYLPTASPPVPLAGFFSAAEVAPIGPKSYTHNQTACVAVFRSEPVG